jgi:hypothetical protein
MTTRACEVVARKISGYCFIQRHARACEQSAILHFDFCIIQRHARACELVHD